jgi:hypothetical protein
VEELVGLEGVLALQEREVGAAVDGMQRARRPSLSDARACRSDWRAKVLAVLLSGPSMSQLEWSGMRQAMKPVIPPVVVEDYLGAGGMGGDAGEEDEKGQGDQKGEHLASYSAFHRQWAMIRKGHDQSLNCLQRLAGL